MGVEVCVCDVCVCMCVCAHSLDTQTHSAPPVAKKTPVAGLDTSDGVAQPKVVKDALLSASLW